MVDLKLFPRCGQLACLFIAVNQAFRFDLFDLNKALLQCQNYIYSLKFLVQSMAIPSLFHDHSQTILKSRFVSVHVKASRIRQSKFLSDEGPTLETLQTTCVLAVHQPFHISICICTLPAQHTMFIKILTDNLYIGSCKHAVS